MRKREVILIFIKYEEFLRSYTFVVSNRFVDLNSCVYYKDEFI